MGSEGESTPTTEFSVKMGKVKYGLGWLRGSWEEREWGERGMTEGQ